MASEINMWKMIATHFRKYRTWIVLNLSLYICFRSIMNASSDQVTREEVLKEYVSIYQGTSFGKFVKFYQGNTFGGICEHLPGNQFSRNTLAFTGEPVF